MNTPPSSEKIAEWRLRASKKNAIVPEYFEVYTNKVDLVCGKCKHSYTRPLVFGIDEPVFVCPNYNCNTRNWVPVTFKTSN
jgi:hypothetical protein